IKLSKKISIDSTTLLIILAVLVLVVYFTYFRGDGTDGPSIDTVKCIGSKSTIYISTGCHVCAQQEELFGENFKYLNIVNCFIEGEKCSQANVTRVPTWMINGEMMTGLQSIEKLINLAGCSE
ncbi:hypothetical protein ACFL6I_27590, partial [candidate division KSB1 bacterium]